MYEEYLARLQRDLTAGVLQLLVLTHIDRLQPIHGYGLIRSMEQAIGHEWFKEGTVYPLLADLERSGIIKSEWGEPSTGPRRKYYRLTPRGRQTARLAALDWQRFRDTMDSILSNRKGATR